MPIASSALIRLGPSSGHDGDRQQQRREDQQDVHEAHQDVVGPAADEAGDAPMVVPTTIAKPTVAKPTEQRYPRAVDDPAEHVADVAVGAEQVLRLVGRAAQEVDARRGPPLDALLDAEQRLVRVDGSR